MAKRLFLMLICSIFLGALSSNFLMATEEKAPESPAFNAVLTEEIEALPEVSENNINQPVLQQYYQPTVVTYLPANYISINGLNLEIIDVPDTAYDSGNHVNKYGEKFLYGHNSYNVFGSLINLGVGSSFSVTYGGVTKNYIIAEKVIYEKDQETQRLQINGSGNYMRNVAYGVSSSGSLYELSIMTCHGDPLGGGDATHRLVIFANSI